MFRLNRLFHNAVNLNEIDELEFELSHGTIPQEEKCYWAHNALTDYVSGTKCNMVILELLLKYSTEGTRGNYLYSSDCPLHIAAKLPYPNVQVIQHILKHGAVANLINCVGSNCTALHSLVQNPNTKLELIELLLRHGADPNRENIREAYFNSLHYALRNPNVKSEVIELLLHFGANVNARAVDNDTPLHFAVRNDNINVDAVNVLLMHGADMHILNCDGRTPLQEALSNCYKQQDYVTCAHCSKENHSVALENVLKQRSTMLCVKVMLKQCILDKTDCDFSHLINLERGDMCQMLLGPICAGILSRLRYYSNFVSYVRQCVSEIIQMKNNNVCCLSLYKYVTSRSECISMGIQINMDKMLRILTENSYTIYYDRIILDIKRDDLWNSLHLIRVFSRQCVSGNQKYVFLDLDTTYNIAKYLSTDDLLHLLLAFYNSTDNDIPQKKQKKCH